MKLGEFSDSFDSLLNSYASQAQFGEQAAKTEIVLDEYEKSVLLTQAQDIIIKSFFERNLNQTGTGFDDSTRRQIDFSSLITVATLKKSADQSTKYDDRGVLFDMPMRVRGAGGTFDVTFDSTFQGGETASTDVLFILNEKLETTVQGYTRPKTYVVVPINYKEYDREMSKPYAQPLKKQAWRLFQNPNTGFDFKSEIVPRFNLEEKESSSDNWKYVIRYIRRPSPIVLVDLPDGLNIDGVTVASECELNPILHPEILQKAVEIAASTRGLVRPESNNRNS